MLAKCLLSFESLFQNVIEDQMNFQTESKTKSGVFFFITSWLVARLWWGIETSRLMIVRIKPKAIINQFAQTQFSPSTWVYHRNKFSCLTVHAEHDQLLIRETPTIEPN